MGSTVIKKVAWKVIEFDDFEIDAGIRYFLGTMSLIEDRSGLNT
jgi:hypothetical protein